MKRQQLPYRTTRLWVRTLRRAKLISMATGKSRIAVIDWLVKKEFDRLKKRGDIDELMEVDIDD